MKTPCVQIGVVMGSASDWVVMKAASETLNDFKVLHECKVLSAHRMPEDMFRYAESASERGLHAIIAGAGGAAHLPGMLASKTTVPILGVPVPGDSLRGVDALYSIVQMPRGIPVATFAIGPSGAVNAALFAISVLALQNSELQARLLKFREKQTEDARGMTANLK